MISLHDDCQVALLRPSSIRRRTTRISASRAAHARWPQAVQRTRALHPLMIASSRAPRWRRTLDGDGLCPQCAVALAGGFPSQYQRLNSLSGGPAASSSSTDGGLSVKPAALDDRSDRLG